MTKSLKPINNPDGNTYVFEIGEQPIKSDWDTIRDYCINDPNKFTYYLEDPSDPWAIVVQDTDASEPQHHLISERNVPPEIRLMFALVRGSNE